MTIKQKVYAQCLHLLNEKIAELENSLVELSESATNNNKSSAGDKHETARAMMQIEQEFIGKQLTKSLEQKAVIEKIDINLHSSRVIKGSLVKTNKGYLFLAIPLGKINFDGNTLMTISPESPLGIKLMGLKVNDSVRLGEVSYCIQDIT